MQCEGRTENLSLSSVLPVRDLCWKHRWAFILLKEFLCNPTQSIFYRSLYRSKIEPCIYSLQLLQEGFSLCFMRLKDIIEDSFTALLFWLPSLGKTSQAFLLNRISLWKHLLLYPCFVSGVAMRFGPFLMLSCNSEILRHFLKSYGLSSTYLRKLSPLGMAKYKRCLTW